MTSGHSVAITTGLCFAAAYLVGSIPFGYLITRRELRRDLRRFDRSRRGLSLLVGRGADPARLPRGVDVAGAVLDTAKVVAVVLSVGTIVRHAGPSVHRADVQSFSAVGFVSDQALFYWESAALWAGLVAVVGHLYSVWLGFRSGQGQLPALGLAVLCTPFGFSVAALGFFIGLIVTRVVRPAIVFALGGFVVYGWVAWVYDFGWSWGFRNGPELALWSAVLAGVVGTRLPAQPAAQR